jgi:hypothetical protein
MRHLLRRGESETELVCHDWAGEATAVIGSVEESAAAANA